MNRKYSVEGQSGMVLLVTLLILLLMAIIAATVTETNVMQLRMAGNDEAKTDALQRALAVVDGLIDRPGNTPVIGDVGYTLCSPDAPDPNNVCNEKTLAVPPGVIAVSEKSKYDYYVERMGPKTVSLGAIGRRDEDEADNFEYLGATFEVAGSYDGTGDNLGRAAVVQGVLIKFGVGPQ